MKGSSEFPYPNKFVWVVWWPFPKVQRALASQTCLERQRTGYSILYAVEI